MYIKLKWVNQNVQPTTTKLYRNDTPVDKSQLITPVATFLNGETEWSDTDVVRGNTYYYTFEVIGETETVFSNPIEVTAVSRTGPGPQTLQFGDLNYGYYGQVPPSQFFGSEELVGALGANLGAATVYTPGPIWDKWARNGKTCYFPRHALYKAVSWKTLYEHGLVYGVDGPGPANAGTDVNQRKVINKGLDSFLVRLPTGVDDRDNPTRALASDITTNTAAHRMYSEIADFLYPLHKATPPQQRAVNIASMTGADLGLTNVNMASMGLTQELNATKQWLTMTLDHSGFIRNDVIGGTLQTQIYASASWRPVLELVDNIEVVV